jgi:hypothetical protein
MITVTARDAAGHQTSKSIELVVESNPVREYPMVFGGATTNNQTQFNQLNNSWGPIRLTREYDSGNGILPVQQYAWYNFAINNFDYIVFSCDEGNADYPAIASGQFDAKIANMVNSVRDNLSSRGMKGVICLGNEPNAGKGIAASDYRAAVEHVIDAFSDEPAPNFLWGVAFSNFNAWGQGSTAGEAWLPRRSNKRFCVATHCYGKTDWLSAEQMIGRSFVPAMNQTGRRDNWIWGIGETSAQEDPNNPDRKGQWFVDFADYVASNGGSFYCPFDTGVGGSDEVGSSARTASLVKTIAQKYKNNNWSDF